MVSVPPSRLERVATALSGHDELAFVAATTGPTDLVAQSLCRDPADPHRCLTRRLGSLAEIRPWETSPAPRNLKADSPALRDVTAGSRGGGISRRTVRG